MIKKGDFLEVEYTGRLTDDHVVFDTTSLDLAKKEGVYSNQMEYGSIIICVGEQQLVKGVDDSLLGREVPDAYTVTLTAEEGFGKKDPKLLKIINTNLLNKQGVRPIPGMQLNVDGVFGVIKTVSSGRTIVDFNHPYAGKSVTYEVKALRIVEDALEKVSSYLKLALPKQKFNIALQDDTLQITIKKTLTPEIEKKLKEKLVKIAKPKKVALMVA